MITRLRKYVKKQSGFHTVSNNHVRHTFLGFTGLLVFLLVWYISGFIFFSKPEFSQFSGFLPLPTLKALTRLAGEAAFWESVLSSLKRVLLGIFFAFLAGFPAGLLIGYYKRIQALTYPPVQLLRMVSPLSWMPIALMIFATFEGAINFLITMATIWPVILNTSLGVSRVNPRWILMAKNQGASDRQLFFKIIIPSSVPYILTSLRLALGVAWIVLVPAEFLGVSSGMGYLINDARDTMEYDRLMAIVIAIGVIGFILDSSIQLVRTRLDWIWK